MAQLRAAISPERLDAFHLAGDDDAAVLARYAWNLALGMAFTPVLHLFEVTLRNAIDGAGHRVVGVPARHGGVPSWLDAVPSVLHPTQEQAVGAAREELRRRGKQRSAGRLIAELNLGFWMHMFDPFYDQGAGRHGRGLLLWTTANLKTAFPNVPAAGRTREAIRNRVDAIRRFRNRVSHHEPIFALDLVAIHAEVTAALRWMNADAARAVECFDRVRAVHAAGPAAFTMRCRDLLGA